MNIVEKGKFTYNNKDLFSNNYFLNKDTYKNIGESPKDFEIIKLLGKGAFGKVYKVRSKKNKELYAMKIFDKEIETINKNMEIKLNPHPNIIKIYNYFKFDNKLYVIMEYINNGNLKDFITMNKSNLISNVLQEDQILCFLLETIWALYEIHKQGYFLNNIKPENILIDDNLKIKYGEFLSTIKEIKEENEEKIIHPYESYYEHNKDEEIKPILKETQKYISKKLKGRKNDIYSLGIILRDLLDIDSVNHNINKIIKDMCEENSLNEDTLNNIFITIGNLFTEKQKNSSIESIVLCLKSFKDFSQLIMKKEKKNLDEINELDLGNKYYSSDDNETDNGKKEIKYYENNVLNKFNEILKLIYDKNGNFMDWNRLINELRLELVKEINEIEVINEIDPNIVYLYLINIIINETTKNNLKENRNDLDDLKNIKDCPLINNISGLMRIESKCSKCSLTKYQFKNYVLLEINPKNILNYKRSNEKINIDKFINDEKKHYDNYTFCTQCFDRTKHKYIKEIYSLPNSLVISISGNSYEENNDLNIEEEIKLNYLDENKKKEKKYELVALLKISRKTNNILFYSFSKFNNSWFLSQRYKGIEQVNMNESHRKSRNVRMLFYQAIQ